MIWWHDGQSKRPVRQDKHGHYFLYHIFCKGGSRAMLLGGGCQNCWGCDRGSAKRLPRELRQGSGGAKIGLLESYNVPESIRNVKQAWSEAVKTNNLEEHMLLDPLYYSFGDKEQKCWGGASKCWGGAKHVGGCTNEVGGGGVAKGIFMIKYLNLESTTQQVMH